METRFKKFTDLVYDEAVLLGKHEQKIKTYVYNNYPYEKFEKLPFSIDREFTKTSIEKTLRFAKKNNDEGLIKLIDDYFDVMDKLQIKKDAKKYNI